MMLIDSNIVIYAAQPRYDEVRQFIHQHAPAVSVITYIEVLGFHRLEGRERELLGDFFRAAEILPLADSVVERAVRLRQERRISLGDSIVAATSLVHRRTLVTHNTRDFEWIEGLNLLDPLAGA